MKEAIVLLAHGSRDRDWSRPFERIAASLCAKLPSTAVRLAFLEHGASLSEAVRSLASEGATSIRVVPVFLGQGGHVKEALPRLMREVSLPNVVMTLDSAIGERAEVIEAIASSAARANP